MEAVPLLEEHHPQIFELFKSTIKNYSRSYEGYLENEKRQIPKLEKKCRVLVEGDEVVGFISAFNHFLSPNEQKVIFFTAKESHQNDSLLPFIKGLVSETIKPEQVLTGAAYEDVSWKTDLFKKLGMKEKGKMWRSYFPLENLTGPPPEHPFKLLTFKELKTQQDGLRKIYDLEVEVVKDIPAPEPLPVKTFEEFLELLERSTKIEDCSLFYEDGGRLIAQSTVGKEGDHAHIHLTSSAKTHRRQGLVTKLKWESMHRLRELGYSKLYTMNDSTNIPMLAINEKMGFIREGEGKAMFFGEKSS